MAAVERADCGPTDLVEGIDGNLVSRDAEEDECVVDTAPLSEMIAAYVAQEERKRPRPQFAGTGARPVSITDTVPFVSPVDELARLAGVTPSALDRIRRRRSKTTSYRNADALVAAIGQPHALHDGTLTVRPARPGASCCGAATPSFAPWSLDGGGATRGKF